MQLYFGLIYPKLIYCITVWVLQIKKLSTLYKSHRISQLEQCVVQIEWKAPYHYLIHFRYLMLETCIPIWFVNIFTKLFLGMRISLYALVVNTILDKILNEALHVPFTHSTQTMQSITYSGTRAYNTVPINIRRGESFVTFKFRLKAHILSNNGSQFAILLRAMLSEAKHRKAPSNIGV